MQPAWIEFTIKQGSVFDETVIWKDSTGTAYNLTGYTAKAEGRKNKADSSTVVTFTVALGGAAGTIRLTLTAAQTRAFTFDKAFYDVEVSPSGAADLSVSTDNICPFAGILVLDREATK